MFPSPIGIFFIYIKNTFVDNTIALNSFRPLWGSFLFIFSKLYPIIIYPCVSVPYGDLFYLYEHLSNICKSYGIVSVPCGDLFYFYMECLRWS